MHIDVITTIRDEAFLLPHFLSHYAFADRILLMDDGSTDGSLAIAQADPRVQLLRFPSPYGLDDAAIAQAYRQVYREYSRGVADWVLVPDIDEFLMHPLGMRVALAQTPRPNIVRSAAGYHVVTDTFPTGPLTALRYGVNAGRTWQKSLIFTPDVNIRWSKGRHASFGKPRIESDFVFLHYRYLGLDWTLERTVRNLTRANQSSEANRLDVVGRDFAATLAENLALTRERFAAALAERQLLEFYPTCSAP